MIISIIIESMDKIILNRLKIYNRIKIKDEDSIVLINLSLKGGSIWIF
jgi:hypothetical protein